MSLNNKIDFAIVFTVHNANPNGDPINGNRPRTDFDGNGEISDVCLKRKIRNRLQDMGERIFVQSDDRCDDGYNSLRTRAEGCEALKNIKWKDSDAFASIACKEWYDVRAFGQVFAFKGKESNVSVGVRGPVSIQTAISVSPVQITETQITKSVNSEPTKDGGKSPDTMGTKYRVDFGIYVTYGSINTQFATKTGFSDDDANKLFEAIKTLFINDASSARPEGSMQIVKVYWWRHNCSIGQYSSAKVHQSLVVKEKMHKDKEEDKKGMNIPRSLKDYDFIYNSLEGLDPIIFEGI